MYPNILFNKVPFEKRHFLFPSSMFLGLLKLSDFYPALEWSTIYTVELIKIFFSSKVEIRVEKTIPFGM